MNGATESTILKPFIEHVQELRRRLVWCALFFMIGAGIGYGLYDTLLHMVQQPLGQTLYFTSPTGGFNFVFKICVFFGTICAFPVISYHLFKYLEPLTPRKSRLEITAYILWSINLAFAGVLFGYFISLPAALHFLVGFGGQEVQSLITADEYFSFALAYIAGFAVLFQLPLVILFINRIKPLKPMHMMKAQRYIIVGSFIVAAILTPTPDPINQLIMALPVVGLYQFSVVLVWLLNRKRYTARTRRTNRIPHPLHTVVELVRVPRTVAHPNTRAVSAGRRIFDVAAPAHRPRHKPDRQSAAQTSKTPHVNALEPQQFVDRFSRVYSSGRATQLIDVVV